MNITKRLPVNAEICVKEGVSQKTGKSYSMTFVVIHTEIYGDVEVLLDTKKDRAGIVLDLLVNT